MQSCPGTVSVEQLAVKQTSWVPLLLLEGGAFFFVCFLDRVSLCSLAWNSPCVPGVELLNSSCYLNAGIQGVSHHPSQGFVLKGTFWNNLIMKCLVFGELRGAGIWAAALRVEQEPLLTAEPLSCSSNAQFSTIDIEVCFLWLLLWSLHFDGLSGPSYWHCFSDLQWFARVGCVEAAAITEDLSSPRKSQECLPNHSRGKHLIKVCAFKTNQQFPPVFLGTC